MNPPQTDNTMIRIKAMMMPRTMSFIFIFCSHIFLLILVPCVLKSCACNKVVMLIASSIRGKSVIIWNLRAQDRIQEIKKYQRILTPQEKNHEEIFKRKNSQWKSIHSRQKATNVIRAIPPPYQLIQYWNTEQYHCLSNRDKRET